MAATVRVGPPGTRASTPDFLAGDPTSTRSDPILLYVPTADGDLEWWLE